jgi:hypothetical protein
MLCRHWQDDIEYDGLQALVEAVGQTCAGGSVDLEANAAATTIATAVGRYAPHCT